MITPFLPPPPTAKEAGPETEFLPKILGIDYQFCKETRFLNPQPETRFLRQLLVHRLNL